MREEILEGDIPFLPVIKPAHIGYYGLIHMLPNARIPIDVDRIIDRFSVPEDLYYIYSVDDGRRTMEKSPGNAEEYLKKYRIRSALTIAETLALCIHTDVLSRHAVWALGSRKVGEPDTIPRIWINPHHAQIELQWWQNIDEPLKKIASPSCLSRVNVKNSLRPF
jgi:hypothetical protein